jgi:hypothetical protein
VNRPSLVLGLVLVLGSASAASGCRTCTEAGCVSEVRLTADTNRIYEVCVGDECVEVGPNKDAVLALDENQGSESVDAIVRFPDGRTKTVSIILSRFQPNGKSCDPVCLIGSLDLGQLTN